MKNDYKKCSRCGKIKSIYAFSQDRSRRDNLCLWCKECQLEYRQINKEWISIRNHRRYVIKKKTILAQQRQYNIRNQIKQKQYRKNRYYNPDTTRKFTIQRHEKQYNIYPGGRLIHDVIAEKILKRRLKKGEIVHHVDNNGLNNRYDNLIICTRSYHNYLHRQHLR